MKWSIILIIFVFFMIVYLLRKGIIEGRKSEPTNGTEINYPDEDEMFAENDYIDEFSPENIDLDETLKILKLQNELNQIEEETEIGDINVNYQNYERK